MVSHQNPPWPPSKPTIWIARFKRGEINLEDEERRRSLKHATNREIVDKIYNVVLDDRKVKLQEIADSMGMSTEHIYVFCQMGAAFVFSINPLEYCAMIKTDKLDNLPSLEFL